MTHAWLSLVVAMAVMIPTAVAESGRWAQPLHTQSGKAEVTEEHPGIRVSPEVFARGQRELLVDDANVLSPGARAERAEFLRHHADESKIVLRVYVFGEGRVLPKETGLEVLFADAEDAVAIYIHGEPQQASLYFPEKLAAAVSEAEQRRALQSAVMQAAGKAEPEDQFEAFLTQMSIRLYWMERMMDDGFVEPEPQAEVEEGMPEKEKFRFPEFSVSEGAFPWIAGGSVLVIALPIAWWVRRSRARYRFPEFEVDPRLGGPHAAGVGAVISYLSANVPPATQREQMMHFEEKH